MTNVVLLHGLGADGSAFQRFGRLLPDTWNIAALDLLGHGSAPRPDHGYALPDHARYIASEIDRRFGTGDADRPVVVGHSYGAAIAVALAALHPSCVRALVLIEAVEDPGTSDGAVEMIQARREGRMIETVERWFPNEGALVRSWIVKTWEAMTIGVIDELDPAWMRFAGDVKCPVTLIHGDHDHGGAGPGPAQHFTNAAAIRIDGAGHFPHATHSRLTAAAVVDAVQAAWPAPA